MQNYIYGWKLEELGYAKVPNDEYDKYMIDKKEFIDMLSNVVIKAKCGWDSVEYRPMKDKNGSVNEYMALCVNGRGERYIPINGNSNACNLCVLGENLW